ncbi:hypothetical protein PtB15_9B317 [Puccinia triticina]|nr:hypothetical protein PtB15_9B317 [Puccinia triticina]
MPLLPLQIQPAIQANKPSQPAESHPVCAPQALTPDLYLLKVILSEPLFLNCQRSRKLPQSQRMTTTEVNQKLWWQKRPPLRDQVKPRNAYSGLKQVASRTGKNIMVNLDQNSDAKHNQVLSQKTKIKIRMGMIIRAYISFWLEKDQFPAFSKLTIQLTGICHVITLILGAGLKALNLPKAIVTPKKANKPFPVLYSIPKEEGNDSSNEITKITNQPADQSKDKYDDVDPDNAEAPHQEPGWENEIDEDMLEECDQMGIAFTLKKQCPM